MKEAITSSLFNRFLWHMRARRGCKVCSYGSDCYLSHCWQWVSILGLRLTMTDQRCLVFYTRLWWGQNWQCPHHLGTSLVMCHESRINAGTCFSCSELMDFNCSFGALSQKFSATQYVKYMTKLTWNQDFFLCLQMFLISHCCDLSITQPNIFRQTK